MADKDKVEETSEKKKGLLSKSKVPLDAVLLVVGPFVAFVVLFMYVMGMLPPSAMTVKVIGAPVEETVESRACPSEKPAPALTSRADEDLMASGETPGAVNEVTVETTGPAAPEGTAGETAPDAAVEMSPETAATERAAEDGTSAEGAGADSVRVERVKQLAKVYEQMKASSVAAIVTNMSNDEAVEILASMKARTAAKVLASLEPEKAAELSLRLTE